MGGAAGSGGDGEGVGVWPSRPSTSGTDTSSLSGASGSPSMASCAKSEPGSMRSRVGQGEALGIAERGGGAAGAYSPSKHAEAFAQEWGITDPKVLAAMLKRNRRMK